MSSNIGESSTSGKKPQYQSIVSGTSGGAAHCFPRFRKLRPGELNIKVFACYAGLWEQSETDGFDGARTLHRASICSAATRGSTQLSRGVL
eukprot:1156916-Pelagomonas_calceolata.AAC.8